MGSSFYAPGKPLTTAVEDAWAPANVIAETFARSGVTNNSIGILSTGRLTVCGGAVIPANRTVTNISFISGNTALSAGTNQWFCLIDQALNVLAKTADDTSTAWSANTVKTLALSATYRPSVNTPVYIGIVVAAATPPTLAGPVISNTSSAVHSIVPMIAASSTTGLTNPASLGATAAALTQVAGQGYAYLT